MATLLPTELWDHILSLLPPDHLQHTARALTLALPKHHNHISSALRWRHLLTTREGQSYQAIKQLRLEDQGTARAVRTIRGEAWREDSQLVVNLVLALPRLQSISLAVGPLASPENFQDLFDPAGLARTQRWNALEQLSLRFNPYVSERSYYTFLKGAYFDSLLHSLSRLPPSSAPRLRRLSFAQDLPPTHGLVRKETLAFGLHDLGGALDGIDVRQIQVPTSGRFARKTKEEKGKMEFAQPIVFFHLSSLTTLSLSPLGSHLTHLTFRIPRRSLLPYLTDLPNPLLHPPLPHLKHLDLSTSHVVDDARLAMMLRYMHRLEELVLDRCSGLISKDAVEEPTAVATLRWLGKVCATPGLTRAEDAVRAWRRLAKDRPSDAPNLWTSSIPSASSSSSSSSQRQQQQQQQDHLIPPVRDLIVLPPPTSLHALGLGLHDLSPSVAQTWTRHFFQGYREGNKKTVEKFEDGLERWRRWEEMGKVAEGGVRLVTFKDALAHDPTFEDVDVGSGGGGTQCGQGNQREGAEGGEGNNYPDPDPLFSRFCQLRHLTPLTPAQAKSLLPALLSQPSSFLFCPHPSPSCSNAPGVPHLSLTTSVGVEGAGMRPAVEDEGVRREREKGVWEMEKREEAEGWERGGHVEGCAHQTARKVWTEDQLS
ncbi:hypothetical protein JCM11641_001144 [Rhodosporidiobolus odoratus]